jgi:hypothetical protein
LFHEVVVGTVQIDSGRSVAFDSIVRDDAIDAVVYAKPIGSVAFAPIALDRDFAGIDDAKPDPDPRGSRNGNQSILENFVVLDHVSVAVPVVNA